MSATECLVSWEGVEGENMSYEVQYRKSSTQDYRQVRKHITTYLIHTNLVSHLLYRIARNFGGQNLGEFTKNRFWRLIFLAN